MTSTVIGLSPESRRILLQAGCEAAALGHTIIGTEHVLLALLGTTDPSLATMFANLQVETASVRATTFLLLGVPPFPTKGAASECPELPVTHRVKTAIEWAMREVTESGGSVVVPTALVIGLLREGQGVAATALGRAGVSVDAARKASS